VRGGSADITTTVFYERDVLKVFREKRRRQLLKAVEKEGLPPVTIYSPFFDSWLDDYNRGDTALAIVRASTV